MIALLLALQLATTPALERIAEIRIHGNHTTPDAEILALSGLTVGEPFTEATLTNTVRRIRASGRFTDVEALRRYLSIADPSQILVMIVVNERLAVTTADPAPGLLKVIRASGMWMPIAGYADGYGFTYGARVAFINALGPHTRVSAPLTWGGERRAGVEAARTFTRGPLSALQVSASAYRRVNPHVQAEDTRLELRGRGERAITSWLRAGAGMRRARVTFGGTRDTHDALDADIAFDTRIDPSFPRNAVYARFARERLWFTDGRRTAANRSTTDLRGYVGIGGSVVLALRAYALTADTGLPPSEQPMLGGGDRLRGYRAGAGAGDNLAAVSAEVRIPVNAPLSVGRFGFTTFVDGGTTWNAGERLRDRRLERGTGAGMYFGGGPVIADLVIAWPEQGKPRLHFSLGVTF